MAQYGREITLVREENCRNFRAFFQPVRSGSYQSTYTHALPLGQLSQGQYTCLAPLGTGLRQGDVIRVGEKSYLVRRVETVSGGDAEIYQWALCAERSEEALWAV